MGHGSPMWGAMRSLRRDQSVTDVKVAKGTAKRIMRFAAPYKVVLIFFLVLVILDAVITAVNPLILRDIINNGILKNDTELIVSLALLVAGLAILDALLSLAQRYVSARIGEGLIYDMRTRVFDHVQRMPIAFFTRTQTGALVTRLNNDVLGAQEAFTDVLSTVIGNLIVVLFILVVMFFLSWEITLLALVLLPIFLLPARWLGRRMQAITREAYVLNAEMNTTMTERFNVSGALLVKLFGRPRDESDTFNRRAGRVRDIGITQAMYARFFFVALTLTAALATALVYGWGGVLAVDGVLSIGTLVALTAYLGAPLRAAHPAVEHQRRPDDDPGFLRAGLRGAGPPADDPGEARRRRDPPGPGPGRVRPRRLLVPESRRGVPRVPRIGREPRPHVGRPDPPRRQLPGRARDDDGARRALRRRQDDDLLPGVAGSTTCAPARSASTASTSGTPPSIRSGGASGW